MLLSITAAWCRACHEMDRTTYAAPEVVALIRDRFVPIRIDADQRPDINDRYNLGGWPTTAFLTAEGDLITGGTFVPADRMPDVLARVVAAFDGRAAELVHSPSPASAAGDPVDPSEPDHDELLRSILSMFDEENGGFGVEPKFPHTSPIHLAIALFRETSDDRWRWIAERTLDAMADGGLWDQEAGGFYRYATTRDWQVPHLEKLLETNAALLRVYVDSAQAFGRAVDRDRCGAISAFITGALRAEDGGYHGSDGDRVLYADANADAAGALLAAATLLDDRALLQEAIASFERVLLACYKPGAGVAHYFDGAPHVRGLLIDQVAALRALLDAHDVTDAEPYQMMGEELGHFIVRDMWDDAAGGFFDRTASDDDVGLLKTRRKPYAANADAAVALARLDRVAHEFDFVPHAAGALRAAAAQLPGQGPEAARYLLARRHLAR